MTTHSSLETLTHQISAMLDMQHAMNSKVHPEWFEQGFQWYRAIWVECAEMLDHYGWKWWKHQQPDMDQVQLELVDIFHFGLSCKIIENSDFQTIATEMASAMQRPALGGDFKETLELLAAHALNTKQFDVASFAGCLEQCGMSADALYRSYVGKNSLNFFRQDHGYKDGTYLKVWNGREDNEYLVDIINRLDSSASDFKDQVYKALEEAYPK
ncbi:MAG: dUTP diphosphatase [Gammaproteobacteria bacterium]|nr:MAG: dUTP diphosphatase [Gammaproteobacteria bacterium]